MAVPTNFPAAPPTDLSADLTPEWLSAALGTEVSAVQAQQVGTGQMGQSWRLSVSYADTATDLPTSFVAKMAGGDPETRTLIADGYRSEELWYTSLGSTVDICPGRTRCADSWCNGHPSPCRTARTCRLARPSMGRPRSSFDRRTSTAL